MNRRNGLTIFKILLEAQIIQIVFSVTDFKLAPEHFDFIVVGAGAAGTVLARKLSEVKSLSILLLEAGGYPPTIAIPAFGMGPLNEDYDWGYVTQPQTHACQALIDQRWQFTRGRGLGGSTIINGMTFTRGNRRDYDTWAELGNEGWAFKDVLPFFKKMEHYNHSSTNPEDAKYRGTYGPFIVSRPPYRSPIADAFLEGGKEMGYSTVDSNAATQTGFSNGDYNIKDGERWSSHKAYLEPVMDRPNLHVVTDAFVLKVIFDKDQRATGVAYEKDGVASEAIATKEVLLSAGATNSPPILMHSGVGPKKVLEKFEIPVVADLKGVGNHLLDHVAVLGMTYTLEKPGAIKKERDFTNENLAAWEKTRQGPFTVPSLVEGVAFVNTRYNKEQEEFPDIELLLASGPSIKVVQDEIYNNFMGVPDARDVVTIYPILQHPKSEGFLTINSSNPRDPPLFDPRYLTNEKDVDVLLEGVKLSAQLMETSGYRRLGAKFHGRILPHCQQHVLGSDEYWRCITRHLSIGLFHQSGTCKMGPANYPDAVVDARLRVYGVKGLRVVDTSITPTIVTGHTMAATVMIGEKAASMILEDWGFSKQGWDEL